MHYTRTTSRRERLCGFTLVELMISLGIAILLIYGINLVFRAVADTVRTGNAVAVAGRKLRSVESAVTIDFEGTYEERDPTSATGATVKQQQLESRWSGITPVVGDIKAAASLTYDQQPRQPAITIFCKRQGAFFNKADLELNSDQAGSDATNPYKFDETENGNVVDFGQPAQFARNGGRIHRIDTVSFFTGGSFAAHAVRTGALITGGEAPQAWVWYGHLLQHGLSNSQPFANDNLGITKFDQVRPIDTKGNPAGSSGPANTALFYQPGQTVADPTGTPLPPGSHRNYYAGDWVLGRMAMTLLPRRGSNNLNPAQSVLGVAPGHTTDQVFAEGTGNESGIGFGAVEQTTSASTSGYDADNLPKDTAVNAARAVPFTSALADAVGIWTGLQTAPTKTLLPTGSIGTVTNGAAPVAYDPTLFNGLVHRYWKLQTDVGTKANWWQRSIVQPDPNVVWPLRFNTVNAFSKPVQDDTKSGGKLQPADKSSLQSTYLAKGCTQFIVEFAGDFLTQDAAGKVTSGTTIKPDGVLDFDVVGTGANAIRRTQWYGLARDVDGDGIAAADSDGLAGGDVVPVFVKMNAPAPVPATSDKSFEKDWANGDRYVVAFGPLDFYPVTKKQPDSIRPWLIRLTVVISDANGTLPSGLSREFVFKVR